MLGSEAPPLQGRIQVEPTFCSLFFHRGLYLHALEHRQERLGLEVHLPYPKPNSASFRVRVEQWLSGELVDHWESRLDLEQASVSLGAFARHPNAVWRIWIEDELAFEAPLPTRLSVVV